MSRFKKDSKITVLNKERTIQEILDTLIYYPAKNVVEFFKSINLSFPRNLRISVLRETLREQVLSTREERASLADEMNYRLSWFNQYTETQLVNLFKFYKDERLEKAYLESLWLEIVNYIVNKKIAETDFDYLIESSINHVKAQGLLIGDIVKYNDDLNAMFYDDAHKIDGLTLDIIRPVLFKSSTLTEIRQIGRKYGVNVPTRLRKNELVDIIVEELKKRNEYSLEKEQKIRKMSVLLIQRFAKTNDIKASTELNKEEVIEYVLSNAKETKESYFVPSSSVYELEAHDVGLAMPEPKAEVELEKDDEEVETEEVIKEESIVEEKSLEDDIVIPIIKEEDITKKVKEEKVLEEAEQTKDEEEKSEVKEKVVYVEKYKEELNDEISTLKNEIAKLKIKNHKLDVKKTVINSLQYSGRKSKKISKQLNLKEKLVVENDKIQKSHIKSDKVQDVFIAGFATEPKKKRRNIIWTILRPILIIVIILLILLLIYGIIRPVGGYAEFKKFDDIFNYFKIKDLGLLDWYTEKVRGLFT